MYKNSTFMVILGLFNTTFAMEEVAINNDTVSQTSGLRVVPTDSNAPIGCFNLLDKWKKKRAKKAHEQERLEQAQPIHVIALQERLKFEASPAYAKMQKLAQKEYEENIKRIQERNAQHEREKLEAENFARVEAQKKAFGAAYKGTYYHVQWDF